MTTKETHGYFLFILICATSSLVSSITLPYMVTNKPPRQTKYTPNPLPETNGAKLNVITTTIPPHSVAVFPTDGTTCLLMEVDGLVEVTFKSHEVDDIVDAYVPENAVAEANCSSEDNITMTITWKAYTMIWNFAKTPEGERWYVGQITVTVGPDLTYYQHIRAYIPEKTFTLSQNQIQFPTPMGRSFTCDESIIDLSSHSEYNPTNLSGKVYLRWFRLQPFKGDDSTFGPAFDCKARFTFRNLAAED